MTLFFTLSFQQQETQETLTESLVRKRFVQYKSKPFIGYFEKTNLTGVVTRAIYSKVDPNIIYFASTNSNKGGDGYKLAKLNIKTGEINPLIGLSNIWSKFQVTSFQSSSSQEKPIDLIFFYSNPDCLLKRLNTADGTITPLAGNGICIMLDSNSKVNATSVSVYPQLISIPMIKYSNIDEIEIYFTQDTKVYQLRNGYISRYRTFSESLQGIVINEREEWQVLLQSTGERIFRNGTRVSFECKNSMSFALDVSSMKTYQSGLQTIVEETIYFSGPLTVSYRELITVYNQDGSVDSFQMGDFVNIIKGTNTASMGDGGLAIESQITNALSISLSTEGIIVFVDISDEMRMIDRSTGLISTIYSSRASYVEKARRAMTGFRSPKDLIIIKNKLNGEEELLISDSQSARLLKYSFGSGISERINASLLDVNRGLYRKVPTFTNPISITTDNESNLLVVNNINYWVSNFIVKFNLETLKSQPLTGSFFSSTSNDTQVDGLSEVLNNPQGVCLAVVNFNLDKRVTLFISDSKNYRILMVDVSTGLSQTLVNKDSGIGAPSGIAYFSNHVYFSDSENHCLWRVNIRTRKLELFAGIPTVKGFNGDNTPLNTTFNSPKGIHIEASDKLLVIADSRNHIIRSIDLGNSPSMVKTIAGSGQEGFNGDGLATAETQLSFPEDVFFVDSQTICIVDTGNQRIRYALNNGVVQTYAGNGEIGNGGDGGFVRNMELYLPKSVTLSQNTMFIADSNNNKIRTVSITTGIVDTLIGGGEFEEGMGIKTKLSYPSSVRYLRLPSGGPQYLAIADTYSNLVKLYNFNTGSVKTIVGGIGDNNLASFASIKPYAIAVSPQSGEYYVTDIQNNKIRKIDRNGIISTIAGKGYGFNGDSPDAKSALLAQPTGIAINLDNEVIFSDSNNNRIRMIHVNGSISTIAGTGVPGFRDGIAENAELNYPTLLKLAPPDFVDIIFIDSLNRMIRKISRRNGMNLVYTIAGNLTATEMNLDEILATNDYLASPQGFTISPNSGAIYLSDSTQNIIRQLTPFCSEGYILNRDLTMCLPICFGVSSNVSESVCSGNGKCLDLNQCSCNQGYTGNNCQLPICFNIPQSAVEVCSRNGSCTGPDNCVCESGYIGRDCSVAICFGQSESNTCSGHGKCVKHDECLCQSSFSGKDCSVNNIALGLGLSSAIVLLIITAICFISFLAFIYMKRKNQKLRETDLVLDERLLDHYESSMGSSSYHVEEADKFIIPIEQLNMDKPIKRLGSGGMGAVFATKFNGMTIAVKVFDLNNLSISENDFKVEAILLSKLRHPNIINFYGVSSTPTKRFIAMECMETSLESVIASLQQGKSTCSLEEKLAILRNIVSGIYYLHHLEPDYIVHRDLKPANILLDKSGTAKLCDFGLGRALSSHTISAITSQIGTSSFMAPELFSGEIGREDARSIDIYSLAIIMWQLIFEIIEPYHSQEAIVLKKLKLLKPIPFTSSYHFHKSVCEDNLRPIIPFSTIEECKQWCGEFLNNTKHEVIFEMSTVIRVMWSHEPSKRPSIDWIMKKIEEWEELLISQ